MADEPVDGPVDEPEESLGQLERVDLRDIWETEAQGFTPWLSKEKNLKILADKLKMDLELLEQEKSVGLFRADILCRNNDDDSMVLVENQLEVTDHKHLGQLMTYAAGLHAVNIVWISADFNDEHQAALNWLNEITSDNFRFFGLEIELWRIGESPPAPQFNIISKPNDWTRSISQASELTGAKATYIRFWTGLRQYLISHENPLRPQAPRGQHWYNFGIGRSGYRLGAVASVKEKWIGVELYIRHDPNGACIQQLLEDQVAIEGEVGAELEWKDLPERIASRVILLKTNTDPENEQDWPQQFAWLDKTLRGFNTAFRERVRELDPMTEPSDDDEEAAE